MGQAPSYEAPGRDACDGIVSDYMCAKDVLQEMYGFSTDNMANW